MPPPHDHPGAGHGAGPPRFGELLVQLAAERGLDFEPPPVAVAAALPGLQRTVEELLARLDDPQERRWLSAALAALSHQVQSAALDQGTGTEYLARADHAVAVAVVVGPEGVLIGRRRDGIPRWVFPGGTVEDGETPEQAAVRECAEETGLRVIAEHVIGQRVHPATDQMISYVACTPVPGASASGPVAGAELVEVLWLGREQVVARMPDLYAPVLRHVDSRIADGQRS